MPIAPFFGRSPGRYRVDPPPDGILGRDGLRKQRLRFANAESYCNPLVASYIFGGSQAAEAAEEGHLETLKVLRDVTRHPTAPSPVRSHFAFSQLHDHHNFKKPLE